MSPKIDTADVKRLLRKLRDDLRRTGNGAQAYIDLLLSDLDRDAPSEMEVLHQIKSFAKMIALADFTPRQEEIWRELWRAATQCLKS